MDILTLLDRQCVRVPLQATDRFGVITELVDLLVAAGRVQDRERVLQSVVAREKMRSTGIGMGLAVPHGKSDGVAKLCMAVGKVIEPVDFESVDERPVRMVFLLASPVDSTGPHIQALASVNRLWLTESFRHGIDSVHSPEGMLDAIRRHR